MYHTLTQTEAIDYYTVSALLSFVSGGFQCFVDDSRLLVHIARLSAVVLVGGQELTRSDCELLTNFAALVNEVLEPIVSVLVLPCSAFYGLRSIKAIILADNFLRDLNNPS